MCILLGLHYDNALQRKHWIINGHPYNNWYNFYYFSPPLTDRFNSSGNSSQLTDRLNGTHRTTDPQHTSPPQQTTKPLGQPRIVNSGVPGVKTVVFDNPAQSLSLFSGNVFYGNRNQKVPVPTQTGMWMADWYKSINFFISFLLNIMYIYLHPKFSCQLICADFSITY